MYCIMGNHTCTSSDSCTFNCDANYCYTLKRENSYNISEKEENLLPKGLNQREL